MTIAAPRLCARCGGRVTGARCVTCERRRGQAMPSSAARGYGGEWPTYARAWLARFPWCGQRRDGRRYAEHSRCTAEGRWVRADVVDHIRSIRAGGTRLDPANHQSLCYACNNRKR